MLKICVSGALGKMGSTVSSVVKEDDECEISGLLEASNHNAVGKIIDGVEVKSDIKEACAKADCLIDFSSPSATMEILEKTLIPVVIGTTGFSEEEMEKIKKSASIRPIVLSPNMSLGINLLFEVVKILAEKLPGFDVEIVEAHHKKKKDAPSGTAKKFAEIIAARRDLDFVYGRQGRDALRKEKELGIHAVRAGEIVGMHDIIFAGSGEVIKISHEALSRRCFAGGAVYAAKWAVTKPPKLYSMAEVLGITK